ncbi:MAG TPA: hypothetical protein VFP54_05500 [Acidimicrobiales bacterium]|nr:hypothetical protein [Acidimicrobiales bacterium]
MATTFKGGPGERAGALNRMGWWIALAGAWMLAVVFLLGSSNEPAVISPPCMAGWYSTGTWCVRDPQPAPTAPSHILVVSGEVGPVGIEPTTEGL